MLHLDDLVWTAAGAVGQLDADGWRNCLTNLATNSWKRLAMWNEVLILWAPCIWPQGLPILSKATVTDSGSKISNLYMKNYACKCLFARMDDEEANNALIAQLLQQDNKDAGYGEYEALQFADDSGDEDYGQSSKRKRPIKKGEYLTAWAFYPGAHSARSCGVALAAGGARKPDKRGAAEPAKGEAGTTQEGSTAAFEDTSATGRKKRKDTGCKREGAKGWSEEEESAFLQGLETHGRDWKAIGALIGTRDHRAVASHAQKHLIRLCLAGQLVPRKMAESGGEGYTLSGKPLDPHSAAARSYGLTAEKLKGALVLPALYLTCDARSCTVCAKILLVLGASLGPAIGMIQVVFYHAAMKRRR